MADTSPFVIREHTFEGQHIRELPEALTDSPEDVLKLHAKSYIPREVASGEVEGQLTIIGFHANAFHKEVYEPCMEYLYRELKDKHGVTIGSIWFADQAAQSTSGLINDEVIGTGQHWFDHSRDIFSMVNIFRSEMKRPLVGFGHSMGAAQAIATAHYHPGLFAALVLVDPSVTLQGAPTMPLMIKWSLSKPETFGSLDEAEKFVRKNPVTEGWNKKVLQRLIDTGFHSRPITLHPEDDTVKPITPLPAEIRAVAHPNPENITHVQDEEQRQRIPDIYREAPSVGPLYNSASRQAYQMLGTLRPPTVYIIGKGSKITVPVEVQHRTDWTGTKSGGSGGVAAGNVKTVTVVGGHFAPFTNPEGTAAAAAEWIASRLETWRAVEAKLQAERERKSQEEKHLLPGDVVQLLKEWDGKLWPNPVGLEDGGRSKL